MFFIFKSVKFVVVLFCSNRFSFHHKQKFVCFFSEILFTSVRVRSFRLSVNVMDEFWTKFIFFFHFSFWFRYQVNNVCTVRICLNDLHKREKCEIFFFVKITSMIIIVYNNIYNYDFFLRVPVQLWQSMNLSSHIPW